MFIHYYRSNQTKSRITLVPRKLNFENNISCYSRGENSGKTAVKIVFFGVVGNEGAVRNICHSIRPRLNGTVQTNICSSNVFKQKIAEFIAAICGGGGYNP